MASRCYESASQQSVSVPLSTGDEKSHGSRIEIFKYSGP
jgi:hypothetical protein